MEFIDLNDQYRRLKPQIDAAIQRVLDRGKFIQGPEVAELEERLVHYTGVKHCVTVANGTDALQIAQMALGIGPGDEVITPGFNYIATTESIRLLGAVPVYVDIDPVTYNLDPHLLEAAITSRTKAIIPVSLYGQCADFEPINAIAARHGITVIEDAAQSFGATYKGRKSCNLAKLACTSFFPTKPLGCYGDGGAVFTPDDDLAKKIRQIASHGQSHKYHHVRVGVNSRLDTIQAAILLQKLNVLDEEIAARSKIAQRYTDTLGHSKMIAPPSVNQPGTSAWAQYTIRASRRAELIAHLQNRSIPTVIHYPLPVYLQPAYYCPSITLEATQGAAETVLSIPCHAYMTEVQVAQVAEAFESFLES